MAVRTLLWLLSLVPLCVSAFGASEGLTHLAAGDLLLTLHDSSGGIRVEHLLDIQTGQDFLATNPLPLFSITLHGVGSTNQLSLGADAGWGKCTVHPHGRGLEIRWSGPVDQALAGLSATATVIPDPNASALRWKLRVENASMNWSLWRVLFPQIALATLGTNAAVLFPRGPGEVQPGVWDRAFSYQGNYPGGWCSMQFMAAYCEGAKPTGLYLGMHDPWGSTKDIVVNSDPTARTLRLSFEHPAPNMGLATNSFTLEGEAVWQILRGDWFDAAMLYKAWARREAKWWPRLSSRRPHRYAALDARVERLGHDGRRAERLCAAGEAVPRLPGRAGRLPLV